LRPINSAARHNLVENAIRPTAVGRKNSRTGCSSETPTCRRVQIRPRDYFDVVLAGLADFRAKSVSDLTPTVWAQTLPQNRCQPRRSSTGNNTSVMGRERSLRPWSCPPGLVMQGIIGAGARPCKSWVILRARSVLLPPSYFDIVAPVKSTPTRSAPQSLRINPLLCYGHHKIIGFDDFEF
jgi:hypothetical protein